MVKKNICVIYDEDVSYAKSLMNIINMDNNNPYNAQIFTQKDELDRYLKNSVPDVLLIQEEAYNYDCMCVDKKSTVETGESKDISVNGDSNECKVVLLCEEETDVKRIQNKKWDSEGRSNIEGLFKYQPGFKLLQAVSSETSTEVSSMINNLTVIGVSGFEDNIHAMLSLSLAIAMSEKARVLYIDMNVFSEAAYLLDTETSDSNKDTLSELLYTYKKNGMEYSKSLKDIIQSRDNIDYILPVRCPEDLLDMDTASLGDLVKKLGIMAGYEYIVIDYPIADSRMTGLMAACDISVLALNDDCQEEQKQRKLNSYLERNNIRSGKFIYKDIKNYGPLFNDRFMKNYRSSGLYLDMKKLSEDIMYDHIDQ